MPEKSDRVTPLVNQGVSTDEAWSDIHAVSRDAIHADRPAREIADSTAITIASWHYDTSRPAMRTLATGRDVSVDLLHAEIMEMYQRENNANAKRSLDLLATWALNHPSRAMDVPSKPVMPVKPMQDALFALQAAVPNMSWEFSDDLPNRITIWCTLDGEQVDFLRQGREMFS